MMKVILNPRYEIVDIQKNDEGEKIYAIKRRRNKEHKVYSKPT